MDQERCGRAKSVFLLDTSDSSAGIFVNRLASLGILWVPTKLRTDNSLCKVIPSSG